MKRGIPATCLRPVCLVVDTKFSSGSKEERNVEYKPEQMEWPQVPSLYPSHPTYLTSRKRLRPLFSRRHPFQMLLDLNTPVFFLPAILF